jgi:hypothetical protein
MAKKATDEYSDRETKRRATEALRRALVTPYKPQKEMVGKSGKKRGAKKTPRSSA